MTAVFDVLLVTGLAALAIAAVTAADLFRSVVIYASFGLLLGLAWARLGAPDIALAEIALAAGVTGALLMVTLRDAHDVEIEEPWRDDLSAGEDLGG